MLKKQITKKLIKYWDLLEHEGLPVKQILLYGSHAAGKSTLESDIDVCVVLSSVKEDRIQEGKKLHLLALQIDPLIEPVVFSLAQYRNDKTSPLLHEIRKNGVRVRRVS